MRLAVVSHQLGGFDGVSIVAEQWASAAEDLGLVVVELAGRFGPRSAHRERRLFAPLWDAFGEEIDPSWDPLSPLLEDADAVLVHNALTLASNPGASLLLKEALLELRLPSIVVHHDPPFEHQARRADRRFPLDLDFAIHLAPTEMTSSGIYAHRGFRPEVLANFVDIAAVTGGDRAAARASLGIAHMELLVLHPVTPYRRKRVDRAVKAVNSLEDATGIPVRYWLTGAAAASENVDPTLDIHLGALRHPHLAGYADAVNDAYAASDFVIMSSDWEGWGLPVLEAAAAGKPVIAHRYPMLEAVTAAGVEVLDIDQIAAWASEVGSSRWDAVLETNRRAAAAFDLAALPGHLCTLLARADAKVVTKA